VKREGSYCLEGKWNKRRTNARQDFGKNGRALASKKRRTVPFSYLSAIAEKAAQKKGHPSANLTAKRVELVNPFWTSDRPGALNKDCIAAAKDTRRKCRRQETKGLNRAHPGEK